MIPLEYLPYIFFVIALFYSSVGFGGGSSYLAMLSLFLSEFYEIRSTALILNLCVVSIGTFFFVKNKVFDFKLFWPFIAISIPLAFFGAQLRLSEKLFFLILGGALILSGLFLVSKYLQPKIKSRDFSLRKRMMLGGAIGLLSGVSGIGGGIFLSPILNLMNWSNPRTIAALASVFILVNSIAGLGGLLYSGSFQVEPTFLLQLVISVIFGGSLGSYLSNKKFNLKVIGILTAILVVYVGTRLIFLHGFGIKI